LLGASIAYHENGAINSSYLLLALLGAISAHISVNAFNEFFDFSSGLDLRTKKTPFSGGSGALPAHPEAAMAVYITAVFTLLITVGTGFFFLSQYGSPLLPLGLAGVLLVVFYTPHINRFTLLCLVAPGFGVGPLMVVGTHYVLSGHYSTLALIASLPLFFLANNLLLLNQFPDVDADRYSGRRTAPVIFGFSTSSHIYGLFLGLAATALITPALMGLTPMLSLISLVALLPAIKSLQGARRYQGETSTLIPAMALNVVSANAAPLLLAVTFWFAS
jgi:1,4-dihydroxy-2-naphthoate octaprenyltransferase